MAIPKRKLGKTGVEVTLLGLGGEGVLRTYGHEKESYTVIHRALDLGINYFESARAYSGSESYYGLALGGRRRDIFLTSKSHARDKAGALRHLQETLKNMKTDHLDLWQVHDVRTEADMAGIFGPGGAIEAFAAAKETGLTRFVGVTGHHDPIILRRCIEMYDFDTVLLPVNPAEPASSSFMDIVMPVAQEKGMGIIGMKVYFRGMAAKVPEFLSMEPFFRYALSWPVSTVVIGCDTPQQMEENVNFARTFQPMPPEEMTDLVDRIAPYAKQLMYYKP
ncbi:MAG: aldo/keto reductase [Deltaproteobacteria bacterium]|nr:aldo/keto reductase [Deltaproteobacteria bacterium]